MDPMQVIRARLGDSSHWLTRHYPNCTVQDYSAERGTLRIKAGQSSADIKIPYIAGRSVQVLNERYVVISYPLGSNGDLLSITSRLNRDEAPYAIAILDFARADVHATGTVPMIRIGADGRSLVEKQIQLALVGPLLAEEALSTFEQLNDSGRVLSSGYNHLREFCGNRSLYMHANGDVVAGKGWSCLKSFKVEREASGASYVTLTVRSLGELASERYILSLNPDNTTFSLYMTRARRPLI
jgi:hypothetical protein